MLESRRPVPSVPDSFLVEFCMGTLNVRKKIEELPKHMNKPSSGFLDYVRPQIAQRGVHLLGIQEAHSPEAGVFVSKSHIRICSGPHDGCKTGDVELWIDAVAHWSVGGHGRAPKSDDFAILHASQRILLVNVLLPACHFDTCVVHAPTSWKKSTDTDEQAAIQRQVKFYRGLDAIFSKRKVWRPLVILGDLNIDFGNIVVDGVDDYQSPKLDSAAAYAFIDIVNKFGLYVPSTDSDVHIGPRHTHAGTLSGQRRIDFNCVPIGWRGSIIRSFVDYEVDLLCEGQDHFLVQCQFKGMLSKHATQTVARRKRISHKMLCDSTPESLATFHARINEIPVPPWSLSVHHHKQFITDQIWDAAEVLVVRKHKPIRPYSSPQVVELSKTRTWHFRRMSLSYRNLRRHTFFRFFDAWRHDTQPDFFLHRLFPPGELYQRVCAGWHAIQLARTTSVQKNNVKEAKAIFLDEAYDDVNAATHETWKVVDQFRRGAGGKRSRAYGQAMPFLEDAQGDLIPDNKGQQKSLGSPFCCC